MKVKAKRWTRILLLVWVLALTAGCSHAGTDGESGQESDTSGVPVDIVSEVAGAVSEEQRSSLSMDDSQKANYQVLLDGSPDADAVYYLYDLTGDGSPELMMGKDTLSVYASHEDSVMTIGTLPAQTVYRSSQYGLLVSCDHDGTLELRQYGYDGEMLTETVLVSASDTSDYDSKASSYMTDAEKLEPYELTDRTPFD